MVARQRRRNLGHLRERVRRLERRQNAFQLAAQAKRAKGLGVGDRDVLDAPCVLQPGVLRPDARIVQSGGDRMRLEHLAVVVLQEIRARAVQDARLTGR